MPPTMLPPAVGPGTRPQAAAAPFPRLARTRPTPSTSAIHRRKRLPPIANVRPPGALAAEGGAAAPAAQVAVVAHPGLGEGAVRLLPVQRRRLVAGAELVE